MDTLSKNRSSIPLFPLSPAKYCLYYLYRHLFAERLKFVFRNELQAIGVHAYVSENQ